MPQRIGLLSRGSSSAGPLRRWSRFEMAQLQLRSVRSKSRKIGGNTLATSDFAHIWISRILVTKVTIGLELRPIRHDLDPE
jgi:hypothetical protein